jgi:hypothetical protein
VKSPGTPDTVRWHTGQSGAPDQGTLRLSLALFVEPNSWSLYWLSVNLWHLYNLYTRAKLVSPIICVGQFNHQNQLGNRCKPNSLSVVLPLLRYDTSARRSVPACPGGLEWGSAGGQVAAVVGAKAVSAGEGLVADEIVGAIRALGLWLFGFDSLSSPLEWGCGRGPCRSSVCPKVIAAAVWPPRAEVVVAAVGVGGGEPPGSCRPAGPPVWGVVRTCGSGTGVPFLMTP